MMRSIGFLMKASGTGGTASTFIGSASTGFSGASLTLNKPVAIAAGDIAVIVGTAANTNEGALSITGGSGGWTLTTVANPGGVTTHVFTKIITSGDVSGTLTINNASSTGGLLSFAIYRGSSHIVIGNQDTDYGNTVHSRNSTIAGLTKTSPSSSIITIMSLLKGSVVTVTEPSGFVKDAFVDSGATAAFIASKVTGYTDGSSMTWNTTTANPTDNFYIALLNIDLY